MAYVMNPISTPLYNRFGCQPVSMFGVILGAVALFLCSFVKKFWFMFFTYSLMFGFATNLCYNPPLILTGAWFPTRHHVLATCTLVAGIPFGKWKICCKICCSYYRCFEVNWQSHKTAEFNKVVIYNLLDSRKHCVVTVFKAIFIGVLNDTIIANFVLECSSNTWTNVALSGKYFN